MASKPSYKSDNSAYSQAERESPFLLKRGYKEEDKEMVKLQIDYNDGSHRKFQIVSNDMTNREMCMLSYHEFNNACRQYDLQDDERFDYFQQTLKGMATESWEAALAGHAPRMNAGLLVCVSASLLTLFTAESFKNLVMYLEQVKKPRYLTAQQLMVRF